VEFQAEVFEQSRQRLGVRFGDVASQWWEGVAETIRAVARQWELRLGEPVPRGGTSLVVRCCRADGRAAVLKLTPEPALARAEAAALRTWAASGRVPELWAVDESAGALLLEAISSQIPLSETEAIHPINDVIAMLHALHAVEPHALPEAEPLQQRVQFIFDLWIARCRKNPAVSARVPPSLLQRGRDLALSLAAERSTRVLLHGDLHPGNVLDGGTARGLVAIDPRPSVGDPAFDAIDWVYWHAQPSDWNIRIKTLGGALRLSERRLERWCAAFAALIAASHVEHRRASTQEIQALVAHAE
jgi:streptomycin 6-kinase